MNIGRLVNHRTLLLGAGFSKNFGGYLANEVNDMLQIDPNITGNKGLRQLIRDDYNYEHALAVARQGGYTQDEVRLLSEAIVNVYKTQNATLVDHFNPHYQAFQTTYPTRTLLQQITSGNWAGDGQNAAYLFSLNQDNLLESLLVSTHTQSNRQYTLPGIRHKDWFFACQSPIGDMERLNSKIDVQDDAGSVSRLDWLNRVNLIKLHGSADWQNQNHDLLVIGGEKELFIKQSPLLTAYHEVFKSVLTTQGMRILIIGYGFMDSHINDILKEGIDAGLGVWVWGYETRQHWDNFMMGQVDGKECVRHGTAIRKHATYFNPPMPTILRGNYLQRRPLHPILDSFFA